MKMTPETAKDFWCPMAHVSSFQGSAYNRNADGIAVDSARCLGTRCPLFTENRPDAEGKVYYHCGLRRD